MKKYLYIIFAWALTMSLTSCEDDDQYSIESVIIGRAWTGDVGMNAENGEPIFSTFTFGGDGFGEEYQYYSYDENCMIISVFNGCGKMDITITLY